MDKLIDIRCALHRNLVMVVCICLCLYFSYHLIAGHRSYSRLSNISYIAQVKGSDLDSLIEERSLIEKKVLMMRPDTLSADLLEERVRLVLGYKLDSELVVISN